MLLVRLFPFIYCDIEKNCVLFYHTINLEFRTYEFSNIISIPNRNTLIVTKENTSTQSIRRELKKFCIIDKITDNNIEILSDYSTLLSEHFKMYINKQWDNLYIIKKCVYKIIVDFTNTDYNAFIKNDDISSPKMDVKTLMFLSKRMYSFENICQLYFYIDWNIIEYYSSAFDLLKNKKNMLFFNIPFVDYKLHHYKILKICKQIDITIDSIANLDFNDIKQLQYSKEIRNIYILLKSTKEVKLYHQLQLWEYSKIHIHIDNTIDNKEIKKILSYDTPDIINLKTSKYNLIRKEYINTLYWGVLYINKTGNIWLNTDKCLGNIREWEHIKFNNLINNKDSLWRIVRNNFEVCSNCIFRNLCPPLSIMELHSKNVFCNKKIKYHAQTKI